MVPARIYYEGREISGNTGCLIAIEACERTGTDKRDCLDLMRRLAVCETAREEFEALTGIETRVGESE